MTGSLVDPKPSPLAAIGERFAQCTLAIEEELMLLDTETLELAQAVEGSPPRRERLADERYAELERFTNGGLPRCRSRLSSLHPYPTLHARRGRLRGGS